MSEYYTKLFVRTKASRKELLDHIVRSSGGVAAGWTVTTNECELDVRQNIDASELGWSDASDAFLYFPYVVEAVADSGRIELNVYLSRVSNVMTALHGHKMSVTAACDWEPALPGEGTLS